MGADGDLTVNFADIFEFVADAVPDQLFLVAGDMRLTYAEMDAQADRTARLLRSTGVKAGDHIGIYAMNRAEWVEAMIACLKLRAIPININYRYVTAELRYLIDNADLVVVIIERRYLPTLAEVLPDVPSVRTVVVLDDGTPAGDGQMTGPVPVGYELLEYDSEPADTASVRIPRSGDDPFIIYTGGTTGMPKGVIWRSEDLFSAACRRPLPDGSMPAGIDELTQHIASAPVVSFLLGPLMHGTAEMGVLTAFSKAGTAVLWSGRRFDSAEVLRIATAERAVSCSLIGDAMAAPILDAYEQNPAQYDLSSLSVLVNSGASLSQEVRDRIHAVLPDVLIYNVYGGTEMAHAGTEDGELGKFRRFRLSDDAAVLDIEGLRPVAPGSGQVGHIARSGPIPLGYYKDSEKTAATFLTDADGVRWVLPGDLATVEQDGTAVLLGRANTVVNTGGEKVFPEEVENALKDHDGITDAVVVGAPDPRFGERVVALVVARKNHQIDVAALEAHCRTLVADYKVPKQIHLVDELIRTPTGKIDIRWARESAARLSAELSSQA